MKRKKSTLKSKSNLSKNLVVISTAALLAIPFATAMSPTKAFAEDAFTFSTATPSDVSANQLTNSQLDQTQSTVQQQQMVQNQQEQQNLQQQQINQQNEQQNQEQSQLNQEEIDRQNQQQMQQNATNTPAPTTQTSSPTSSSGDKEKTDADAEKKPTTSAKTKNVTGRGTLVSEDGKTYKLVVDDEESYTLVTKQSDISAILPLLANQDIVIEVAAKLKDSTLTATKLNIASELSKAKMAEITAAIQEDKLSKPNTEVTGKGYLVKDGSSYVLEVNDYQKYKLTSKREDITGVFPVLSDQNIIITVKALKTGDTLDVSGMNINTALSSIQKEGVENVVKEYVLSHDTATFTGTGTIEKVNNVYYMDIYDTRFEMVPQTNDILKTIPLLAGEDIEVQVNGTKVKDVIQVTYLTIVSDITADKLNQIRNALGQTTNTPTTTNSTSTAPTNTASNGVGGGQTPYYLTPVTSNGQTSYYITPASGGTGATAGTGSGLGGFSNLSSQLSQMMSQLNANGGFGSSFSNLASQLPNYSNTTPTAQSTTKPATSSSTTGFSNSGASNSSGFIVKN